MPINDTPLNELAHNLAKKKLAAVGLEPKPPTELRGCVARCQHGKLGVIFRESNGVYYGIGFDGKNWQSKHPAIEATTLQAYIDIVADENASNPYC